MTCIRRPLRFEAIRCLLHPQLYTRPRVSSRALLTGSEIHRNEEINGRVHFSSYSSKWQSTSEPLSSTHPSSSIDPERLAHLNPDPSSYALTPFTDRCSVIIEAGAGGNGCVSFLREKFIAEGPPNGGDGGLGGNVFIQAVRGETSLHKLARRPILKAGRGGHGRGGARNGEKGADILFTVPVGTVVKEVERIDIVAEEQQLREAQRANARYRKHRQHDSRYFEDGDDETQALDEQEDAPGPTGRDRWVRYPGEMGNFDREIGSRPPPPARSKLNPLAAMQPQGRIRLDLDEPMETPLLLIAGAGGGLGNSNYVTRDIPRPKFATKGDPGAKIELYLELKVLADVGLVGLPNAGKSTLLRALTNSRTRIGDWPFTTLQPNIGTVVLDNHSGRPLLRAYEKNGAPRTSVTIADIPGLIEGAHLDKGLGLGFLRHVERAAMLAFVVDLSAGEAVPALQALWHEVAAYEALRSREINMETETHIAPPDTQELDGETDHSWSQVSSKYDPGRSLPPSAPISSKPWFVVATKADLPETQENFERLKAYVSALNDGHVEHPGGKTNGWRRHVRAIPVSAIRSEGVEAIPKLVVELLG